jgi:type IV pilus assembly protein PilW
MKRKHQGFSLVELMIAVALGLILMTGVMKMFLGSKVAFSSQQAISRIQETGRLAMEFMAKDIRMAGYMGCVSRDTLKVDSTLKDGASYPNDMLTSIQGYSINGSGNGGPAGVVLAPVALKNTDMFAVTSAAASGVVVIKNNDSATMFGTLGLVEPNGCGSSTRYSGICDGDILLVTDCSKGRVFQASNVNNASGEIHITHAASGTPGNDPTSWGGNSDPDHTFGPGSEIIKVTKTLYYIGLSPTTGRPSLWQNVNGVTSELLEGVEDMSISYGRDTSADFIPDTYTNAAGVGGDWSHVLSLRLQVLVQTAEDNVVPEKQKYSFADDVNKTAPDLRMRQVFINTVGIRSRLP